MSTNDKIMKTMFKFKGHYYTIYNKKILISDHPAKIKYVMDKERAILQIPMSYNGWLVWKGLVRQSLQELSREDMHN